MPPFRHEPADWEHSLTSKEKIIFWRKIKRSASRRYSIYINGLWIFLKYCLAHLNCSALLPVYPAWQSQRYFPTRSTPVAPFWHGLEEHSLISTQNKCKVTWSHFKRERYRRYGSVSGNKSIIIVLFVITWHFVVLIDAITATIQSEYKVYSLKTSRNCSSLKFLVHIILKKVNVMEIVFILFFYFLFMDCLDDWSKNNKIPVSGFLPRHWFF